MRKSPGQKSKKTVRTARRRTAKKSVRPKNAGGIRLRKLRHDNHFQIVGIGASAGGLDALKHFFERLPPDTGMGFVVVQHLDPKHPSMLTELISRVTRMPVSEVTDGTVVQPNSVYVIPPNTRMAIMHHTLCLLPRTGDGDPPMPVDFFFSSLAADLKSRAIGVILSGTASDGTHGLLAIKAAGGVTFAQDKESATFFGMPGSAIEAGVVDIVCSPDKIAVELERFSHRPLPELPRERRTEEPTFADEASLAKVHFLLRSHSGVDFAHYKPTTINRRIARRMLLRKMPDLEEYVKYLNENPAEVMDLYQDMLILVTNFFRDPGAFEVLKKVIFPRMLADRTDRNSVRIWVPGCATGEEAYSIAITLIEYLRSKPTDRGIQVFATDLSETAIRIARRGVYSGTIVNDVTPERLRRFFAKTDGGYQVSKTVRDLCVFATHDLVKDPPFSHMDLISCRNVLIYLSPTLQKRVIPMFHFALNQEGILLLGTSETIGSFGGLFGVVDKKYKIYARKGGTSRTDVRNVSQMGETNSRVSPLDVQAGENNPAHDLQAEMDRIVLAKYSPPGVLVNSALEVIRYQGQTGPFLQPAPGTPSLKILRMAREGLLVGLRAGLQQATKHNRAVERKKIPVKTDNGIQLIDLEIIPIKSAATARDQHFLILFKQSETDGSTPKQAVAGSKPSKRGAAPGAIERLERELKATRAYLQSTIEEQEATNEELHLALEEIRSSNEELQSTNEEIETAKEELQSTNEELVTVNEELRSSNSELSVVNNDLVNLLNNISFAVVMIDNETRIRRFTPAAARAFSLLPGDIGRPITDLRLNIDIKNLGSTVEKVVTTLVQEEFEVRDQAGRACLLRINPYRTLENQIEGVILSLVDMEVEQKALREAETARKALKDFQDFANEPIVMTDNNFFVTHVNPAFSRMFQTSNAEVEGQVLFTAMGGRWDTTEFRRIVERLGSPGGDFTNIEAEIVVPGSGLRRIRFRGQRIDQGSDNGSLLLVLTITEVS